MYVIQSSVRGVLPYRLFVGNTSFGNKLTVNEPATITSFETQIDYEQDNEVTLSRGAISSKELFT